MGKGNPTPAPDARVWWEGLKWVEATRVQLERLTEAVFEYTGALADARMRYLCSDDSEVSRSWREGYDRDHEPFDPDRPIRVPSLSLRLQVGIELEFFIVAVRNVMRAEERLLGPQRTDMTGQRVFHLLRNSQEHFDEVGGWSEIEIQKDWQGFKNTPLMVTGKEIFFGEDLDDTIPLSRVEAWLTRVWLALTTCLTGIGESVPSDWRASVVEGDDELTWPHERIRYHWSIPKVEAKEWPRESMPPEMQDLLAAKFAALRRRDPKD